MLFMAIFLVISVGVLLQYIYQVTSNSKRSENNEEITNWLIEELKR